MNPFDIVLVKTGEEVQYHDTPMYYAGQDGWYVNTPTLFGVAHTKLSKNPPHLAPIEVAFKLNDKKLPRYIIKQAHDFFRRVWQTKHSEAMVFITYHDEKDSFSLWVPEQYVSHVSVNYKLDAGAIKGGWRAVGTIHSHCNFGAFHSGTDQHDMSGMPGLHITLGHVDKDEPEAAVALSANKQQFDVKSLANIIDESRPKNHKGFDTAPDFWFEYVKTGAAPWQGGTISYKPKTTTTYLPAKSTKHWSDFDYSGFETESWRTPSKRPERLPDGFVQTPMFPDPEEEDMFSHWADEIQDCENFLEGEAFQLATIGFVLNYTITYNPKRASAYLKKVGYADYTEFETDD